MPSAFSSDTARLSVDGTPLYYPNAAKDLLICGGKKSGRRLPGRPSWKIGPPIKLVIMPREVLDFTHVEPIQAVV